MGTSVPSVSDAELEVLKVLWDRGPGTVRDVDAALRRRRRRWAYNTILTLLSRLRDKGFVAGEKDKHNAAGAIVFRAVVARQRLLSLGLTELANRICDGTASPLVHALVQGQRFTQDEIAGFRKLLDKLDGKSTPPADKD